MKMLPAGLLGIAIVLSSPIAIAATYQDTCDEASCAPFQPSNSYVVQKAANLGAANGAIVGDTVGLMREGTCGMRFIWWTVIDAPVYNSSDLEIAGNLCLTDW